MGPQRTISATIRNELQRLLTGSDDLGLFETTMEGAISGDEVIERSRVNIPDTVRRAQHYLKIARPKRDASNFNDAVNFTTLCCFFRASITIEDMQVGPILVTETEPVERLSLHQQEFELPKPEEFSLVTSPFHVLLEIGLTRASVGSDSLAEKEAQVLEGEARALHRSYANLAGRASEKLWSIKELETDPQTELVTFYAQQFYDRYNWLVGDYMQATNVDTVATANYLNSPHCRSILHRLKAKSPDKIKTGLHHLKSFVEATIREHRLLRDTAIDLSVSAAREQCEQLRSLFSVEVQSREVNNALSPLQVIGKDDDYQWESFDPFKDHELHIRVAYRVLGGLRPILHFGSYRLASSSEERWISIVLGYPLTSENAFRFVKRAAGLLTSTDSPLSVRIFDASECDEEATIPSFADLDISLLTRNHVSATYLEVHSGSTAVFMDVVPSLAIDHQVGLTCPDSAWRTEFGDSLWTLIADAIELSGSSEHLRIIAAHCLSRLRIVSSETKDADSMQTQE